MGRRDEILEQIRRDADADALAHPAPEPTVEQMRQVGQVFRAVRRDQRERGAA